MMEEPEWPVCAGLLSNLFISRCTPASRSTLATVAVRETGSDGKREATRRLVFERDLVKDCGDPCAYGDNDLSCVGSRRTDETEDGDGCASSREGSLESAERVTGSELLTGSCSSDRRSGEAVMGDTDLFVPWLDGERPALRPDEVIEGELDATGDVWGLLKPVRWTSWSTLRPPRERGEDRADDDVFNERWIAGSWIPRFEFARLRVASGSVVCRVLAGFCKGLLCSPEGLGGLLDM